MRKVSLAVSVFALCIFATISANFICMANDYESISIEPVSNSAPCNMVLNIAYQATEMATSENVISESRKILSEEEIELIALVTMAEAEGECEEGKRLVIDTILNRMDSEYFPDTIREVIYQPSQFSSMWNGRVERCRVREDICLLVKEELEIKTNSDVIFFTAGGYSQYGKPMFQVGNHYFSSYD